MKRLVLLTALLALVLGMVGSAAAADIKATGQWAVEFLFSDNFDMNKNDSTKSGDNSGDFNVLQRARTQFEFIANENLKAVLATEIGIGRWGQPGVFALGDSPTAIEVRRAYLQFKLPDTTIAMTAGHQGISLPAAFGGGSMILDEEFTALVASTPVTDWLSVAALYGRFYDGDTNTLDNKGYDNSSFDTGALLLPFKFDGVSFTPYFVYAYAGSTGAKGFQSSYATLTNGLISQGGYALATGAGLGQNGVNAYWYGTSFNLDAFDPIKVMADIAYGEANVIGVKNANRHGWMADLAIDYTGFDFMTPELFFVYTSGDDKDLTDSERMPTLKASTWSAGNFFFAGDTSGLRTATASGGGFQNAQVGFWALGASLKDISYIENLKHTLTIMYVQGTNDKNFATSNLAVYGQTLTEKDNLWEFDLHNKYKIYDQLTFFFDLGYIVSDIDKSTWAAKNADNTDAFKLATGLLYEF